MIDTTNVQNPTTAGLALDNMLAVLIYCGRGLCMGPRQTEHMLCAIREECVEYSDCISLMTSVLILPPPSDPCLNHIKGPKRAGSALCFWAGCMQAYFQYAIQISSQFRPLIQAQQWRILLNTSLPMWFPTGFTSQPSLYIGNQAATKQTF